MSDRKPVGIQVDDIQRESPFVQHSLDLAKQDAFVTSFAVDFNHYKAIPSPIGQKDKGDYRRSDGVDTITSNGFIYKCGGVFSATMTDDKRDKKKSDGGFVDVAVGRLVLPRFYNAPGTPDMSNGDRIYLAPGDRLYVADPKADTKVATYHKMDYIPDADNIPMYPIVSIEFLIDSRNIEYKLGVDFCLTSEGSIRWEKGGKNPGIDPDTGKGRIYSIRYLYNAFWYVVSLPKEIRITNVTTNGVRSPERMPYYAEIVREYIYHNQNKGDQVNQLKSKTPGRVVEAPTESIDPANPVIPVDMSTITEGE
jgi:hypothetical protein